MLKAIVFDFDGVIVDSEPTHYQAFLQAVEPLGIHFSYQDYLREYLGFDDREAYEMMFKKIGRQLKAGQLAQLIASKATIFESLVEQGIDTIPGTLDLINDARQANLPIAIASGATRRDIDIILKGLHLENVFHPIITADMVARSKPDPTSYALAAQGLAKQWPHLAITPGDCLAIEDTQAGLQSATSAGLMGLGLLTTSPAGDLSLAKKVLPNLKDVGLADLKAWF